ncbi:MAG: hypothetical protein JXA33_09735 [Anaerolineae bacterium]|nr:hypothetical protein [Anaerolineae bacterium]
MKRALIIAILVFIVCIGVGILVAVMMLMNNKIGPLQQDALSRPRIYAYKDWQSLGIQVNPGDIIHIRAQGTWLYTPGEYHGPEGHHRYRAPNTYPINAVPGGVLLGRIGEDGYPFIVSRGGRFVVDHAGFLYLRINDDILSDNEGYVTVEVDVISPESE